MFKSIAQAVLYHSENQPNKLCLVDHKSSVTYKEYAEKIKRYASFFIEEGLRKGDKVVVEGDQTIEFLAIDLALQLIGCIFVPVEHNCAKDKIQSFIDTTEAKAVIVVKKEEYSINNIYTHEQVITNSINNTIDLKQDVISDNDICQMLFTTGTTGKEKGIVLTYKNVSATAESVMCGMKMEKDNIELVTSPLNHAHGLRRYYGNMYNGSTVVIQRSIMDIKSFFDNIEKYKVTAIAIVPAALTTVLKLSKNKLSEYSEQIRYIQIGSAPVLEDVVRQLSEMLPKTHIYNFYGSSEGGCICVYDLNCKNLKIHSIGKPVNKTRVIIVDDNRKEIKSSKENTGLIATIGEMNMLGYWKDKEETEKALIDGIVYTNDVAYIDEDGDVILLGRRGDVINVGGNKVSPEEIENAAKKIEGVVDCVCIPIKDTAKGNVPKLFVQLDSDKEFNPIEIRKFLATQLENYKVPAVIEQIDEVPRSFNGKLLRRKLQDLN